jgi:hypothetical protein
MGGAGLAETGARAPFVRFRPWALRGVAPAPGRLAQAVAEFGLLARAPAERAQAQPADERAPVLLVRGEQADVVIPALVAGEDAGDGAVADLLRRSRRAAGQVAHHRRVAVQLDQQVRFGPLRRPGQGAGLMRLRLRHGS